MTIDVNDVDSCLDIKVHSWKVIFDDVIDVFYLLMVDVYVMFDVNALSVDDPLALMEGIQFNVDDVLQNSPAMKHRGHHLLPRDQQR